MPAMSDTTRLERSDSWHRTTSPEQAIYLCKTAFYPHQLRVLGATTSFGFDHRVTCAGPMKLAQVTYETGVQPRASYHVNIPLEGWFESRHRGVAITATPEVATVFGPEGET